MIITIEEKRINSDKSKVKKQRLKNKKNSNTVTYVRVLCCAILAHFVTTRVTTVAR